MTASFRLEDCVSSHVGHVRTGNEDSHLRLPEAAVWLVADGMGGHQNGYFASSAIIDAVAALQVPADLEQACDLVAGAIRSANSRILDKSRELGGQMGSTFVALIVRGTEFAVLWAGDSRAYVLRDGRLIQLTRDHTQVEELVERGLLTPGEGANHPMNHVLTRAVGVQDRLAIDAVRDAVAAQDAFLLCSDGLHSVLADGEIEAILADRTSDGCEALVAACLAKGAPDNVTVALVAANETTLLAPGGQST